MITVCIVYNWIMWVGLYLVYGWMGSTDSKDEHDILLEEQRLEESTKEDKKLNHLLRFRFFSWGSSMSAARISKALVVLGLVLLLVAGLAGCSSNDGSTALKTENAALKARIPTFVYNSYQSNELGMEFSYPATWVRQDTQQIVPFFVSPEGIANVGVTREILPQAITSDAYFSALNQQLQAQGYILISVRQTQVGSVSGLQAVYLNKGLLQVFVVVAKGQTAWSLIETAKADEFIDWAHTFNEISHSFKIK